MIEAWDAAPGDPILNDNPDEGGHGLTLVTALSYRCGFSRPRYGVKVVWAELPIYGLIDPYLLPPARDPAVLHRVHQGLLRLLLGPIADRT